MPPPSGQSERLMAAFDRGEQAPVAWPVGQQRRERRGGWRSGTVRRSHCSAASMAMAVRRSAFIRCCIGAFGEDGVQRGDAEFGRLLHHEVGGVALQQRECQPQIGTLDLRVCPVLDPQSGALAPDGLDTGSKFAVAAIEQP